MRGSLNITSAITDPALLDLPWDVPLGEWPDEYIAALPKGLSRHLVRFAHLSGHVIAIRRRPMTWPVGSTRCSVRCRASRSRASIPSP